MVVGHFSSGVVVSLDTECWVMSEKHELHMGWSRCSQGSGGPRPVVAPSQLSHLGGGHPSGVKNINLITLFVASRGVVCPKKSPGGANPAELSLVLVAQEVGTRAGGLTGSCRDSVEI